MARLVTAALSFTTVALAIQTHLDHDSSDILATCSLEQFEESLQSLIQQNLLRKSDITGAASEHYLDIASTRKCKFDHAKWPRSDKKLIVNIGEGTTATWWLDGLMNDLGFHTKHFFDRDMNNVGGKMLDDYEYVSDTPVSALTWDILNSHPQALFIMSLRNPVEWAESRFKHGDGGDWMKAHFVDDAAVPCGQYNPKYPLPPPGEAYDRDDPRDAVYKHSKQRFEVAELNYVVNSAWSACVLNGTGRLLPFNLFNKAEADSELIEKLVPFLEEHGMQKPNWEMRVKMAKAKLAKLHSQVTPSPDTYDSKVIKTTSPAPDPEPNISKISTIVASKLQPWEDIFQDG